MLALHVPARVWNVPASLDLILMQLEEISSIHEIFTCGWLVKVAGRRGSME